MRPDAPHTYHHNVTSPSTPVAPAPTTTQPRQAATPPHLTNTQRLLGIDLARGLALIGMMAAHFMLSTTPELLNPTTWGGLVNGRSSILFATLAGVSLALTTGRTTPPTGDALIAARGKILIRGATIYIIGAFLTALDTPIAVILQTYGILFALAVPFLTLTRRTLILIAIPLTIVGPLLTYSLTSASNLFLLSLPLPESLFNPSYPALSWMPFILTGMAIGRTNLTLKKTQAGLLALGVALAVIGYSSVTLTSMTAEALSTESSITAKDDDNTTDIETPYIDDQEYGTATLEDLGPGQFLVNGFVRDEINLEGLECTDSTYTDSTTDQRDVNCYRYEELSTPTQPSDNVDLNEIILTPFRDLATTWATADPHSATPHEIVGSGGFAIATIGLCLLIAHAARHLLYPIIAMGSMSLTIYSLHVLSYRFMQETVMMSGQFTWGLWLGSIIALAGFASLWRMKFTKGPLERGVNTIIRATIPHGDRSPMTDSRFPASGKSASGFDASTDVKKPQELAESSPAQHGTGDLDPSNQEQCKDTQ